MKNIKIPQSDLNVSEIALAACRRESVMSPKLQLNSSFSAPTHRLWFR